MSPKPPRSPEMQPLCNEIARRMARLPATAMTAEFRGLRREYSRKIAQAPARQVITLGLCLLERHNHRTFAYELIHAHRLARESLGARDLERLGRGMDAWWKVDTFGVYLGGPAWREGQIRDARVIRWARSRDLWWRRAALVCTVALNVKARGGQGDVPRTLRICRLLVDDREDMVIKALSWALRALVAHDRRAVQAFLARYEGRLAARVKREVTNKLRTGLKNPRRQR